jgi:hypothetical protein
MSPPLSVFLRNQRSTLSKSLAPPRTQWPQSLVGFLCDPGVLRGERLLAQPTFFRAGARAWRLEINART